MGDTEQLHRTIKDQRKALGALNALLKKLKDENRELRKQMGIDKEKPRT